ncbi:ArsR/SmtB family transcription factor [Parerythrobacter aestuarii]|uniref:ArsR/SmtB family transcription factor n=1 Tax=Parerythrobacter aestuarii TaxID=3020909 RepID=UPI0024DE67CF|nr:metalloregulator ArsR/SmtB family transcription factor [Parerythrobacter aestuarii]
MSRTIPDPDLDMIEQLKAAAHPLRYRIIAALQGGELNVGELEEVTGIGQPGLSQQLGVLRKASLVRNRKEAKLVFYSLDTEAMGRLGACFDKLAGRDAQATNRPRRPAPGAANFARMS